MFRLLCVIVAIITVGCSADSLWTVSNDYVVVHVVYHHRTCSREVATWWANDFENCFIHRKYKTSLDLFNIVTRLLDHSKFCIKFSTKECRPNYDGFVHIMDKVIKMIKEYSNMHVERLMNSGVIAYAERDKIKDLNCVENILTKDIYAPCFSSVISTYEQLLGENETYDLIFQKEVEKAILCTNKAMNQCCKHVKIVINKVIRYILGVNQPDRDDIEEDFTTYEASGITESPMLSSKFRKTGKESIGDSTEIPKLRDSIKISNSTEFSVTGKGIINFKFTNYNETSIPLKENNSNNNDDHKFRMLQIFLNSTDVPIFGELTTFKKVPISETASIRNNTKHAENPEHTIPSVFPNFRSRNNNVNTEIPTSISALMAISSKPKDLPNSTTLGISNGSMALDSKTEEDSNVFVWEDAKDLELTEISVPFKFRMTTDSSVTLDPFKSSVLPNLRRKDNDSTEIPASTSILKTTISPKSKDLPNDTAFDVSEGINAENTGMQHLPTSADYSIPLDPIKSSVFPNLRKKDNDPHSTDILDFTSIFKTTISPKPKVPPNDTEFDISESDIDEDIGMHTFLFDWVYEEDLVDLAETPLPFNLPTSPDYSMPLDPIKSSSLPNLRRKDNDPQSTELPTSTSSLEAISSKLETLPIYTTKDTDTPFFAETGEYTDVFDWLDKTTKLTESASHTTFKLTSISKSTASTNSAKSIGVTRSTTSTNLPKSKRRLRSTQLPKSTRLPRSTRSTKPPTKSTDQPRSTRSTKPSIPTDSPKTITSRKPPEDFGSIDRRSRDTYYEPPRPTEAPRRWYDFIVQPFVRLWNTVKSWFGF